jgi:LmbE family N-acetylglucosaminyl deacetylase
VDVTHVFNAKLAAIRKHETQLAYIDYEEAVRGLNSYRAQMSGLRGFAEAFLETDEKSHRRMFSTVFRVRT